MTLKSVVFPAPFGPISAQIAPALTVNVAPATARRPPKARWTSSISSIALLVTEHHLFLAPEQPLRAQADEDDENDADDDEPQRSEPFGRHRQLHQPEPFEHDPEDGAADGNAQIAPHAAEDQDRVPEEREARLELDRVDDRDVEREEVARDRR